MSKNNPDVMSELASRMAAMTTENSRNNPAVDRRTPPRPANPDENELVRPEPVNPDENGPVGPEPRSEVADTTGEELEGGHDPAPEMPGVGGGKRSSQAPPRKGRGRSSGGKPASKKTAAPVPPMKTRSKTIIPEVSPA
jgi:hypothetical protein